MPYTPPTPAEFKARFGEFASLPDDAVGRFLALAGRFVDTTWIEADYPLAIAYLAAHFAHLMKPLGVGSSGAGGGGISTYMRSVAFGDRRIVYAALPSSQAQQAVSTEALGSTMYGQLYLMMLRRNSPMVLVV